MRLTDGGQTLFTLLGVADPVPCKEDTNPVLARELKALRRFRSMLDTEGSAEGALSLSPVLSHSVSHFLSLSVLFLPLKPN